MAVAGSSATFPTQPQAPPSAPPSLEELIQLVMLEPDVSRISQTLRSLTKDTVLVSLLAGGQDPLELLSPGANTLGYLYILYVCARASEDARDLYFIHWQRSARLSSTAAPPPQRSAVETFCRTFDPAQARLAPERGEYWCHLG